MDPLHATPRVLRVIRTVLGSDERSGAVLRAALVSSGQPALPERLEDLLVFVRAHLVPVLSQQVGARLATVVLTDIDQAIQKEIRKSARRLATAKRVDVDDAPASVRRKPKSAVLVIDRDRVGASMLARSILHGGFDVAVADAQTIEPSVCDELDPDVIVMTERDALDMAPSLRALLVARPQMAIVLRVAEHERLAESMLQAVGKRRFVSIARTAPTLEVVGLARQLCAAG